MHFRLNSFFKSPGRYVVSWEGVTIGLELHFRYWYCVQNITKRNPWARLCRVVNSIKALRLHACLPPPPTPSWSQLSLVTNLTVSPMLKFWSFQLVNWFIVVPSQNSTIVIKMRLKKGMINLISRVRIGI